MTAADPAVRSDNRCACGCGKLRVLRIPRKSGANARRRAELELQLAADPFHSAACARRWYGVDIAEQPQMDNGQGERWDEEHGDGRALFTLPRRAC